MSNRYKNTSATKLAMNRMSNFGVLPLRHSSPSASESRYTPPPFGITKTPIFQRRNPYYSIHPHTLHDVNHQDSFDCAVDPIEREGYADPFIAYDNFAVQSNGRTQFTHRTHHTQPIHSDDFPSTPIKTIEYHGEHESFPQSPSLLLPSDTISSPITKTQKPLNSKQQYRTLDNDEKGDIWRYEPSWLSELQEALNRLGINQTTTILIIVAVFIAVQFNQYNTLRDASRIIHSTAVYNNATYTNDINLMRDMMREQQEEIKKLNETIANKTMSINVKTDDLQQRIDQNTADIVVNTDGIDVNKDNISNAQREVISNAKKTDGIVKNMTQMVDRVDIRDTLEYFERMSSINWISGVDTMPQTIPYAFNDYEEKDEHRNNDKMGVFDALKRGIAIFTNETAGMFNGNGKITANIDITDSATPNTLRPNDCLQFSVNKEHRWIEIKMMERIVPREFEYIHIDKERLHMNDRNKSPKRFFVFGKVRGGEWKDIAVKEDKILGVDESAIKLELDTKMGIEFMRIEYDVNEDAQATRIYRMRVHGDPDIYES